MWECANALLVSSKVQAATVFGMGCMSLFCCHLNAHNLHFHKALRILLQVALLRSEEFMLFRQNNTSMVLGTDMKKHFDIMSRFQVCSCFCIMTLHSLGANQPAAML